MTHKEGAATVRHDPDRLRFVVATEAGEAVLEYQKTGGAYVLAHTLVPEAMEGQGIGSALAEAALAHVRDEGATAVPLCPFVAAYVQRHPEWQSVVATGSRL